MNQTLEILERLIGFNSISANSNLGIIDYIDDFLRARGFAVHRVYDSTGEKSGIYASLGPAGAGVMLSAHTDVVPVAGQDWRCDPFRLTRNGDRVYGRGTTDMKGYVASVMALADRASRADLKEPLKIAFSYDEEVGCVGIQQMIGALESTIGLPRVCFVGEPTEMQVAVGHKGKAALRATCHGQSGHSALAPQFANALHLATDFISELRALQSDFQRNGARDAAYDIPYSTVHVGKLTGGMALNIVPDSAVMDFEYRHLAPDRSEDILASILAGAERVMTAHRSDFPEALVEVDQYNSYPGFNVAEDAPVVSFAQELCLSNEVTKVPFGTEAGYFDALGIPTVVCGPGSMTGQGHKPDEYITLAQLQACDGMMDRLLQNMTS
jgi:acetylornithine deacetylase